ncbi:dolichyl-diphosphooligosaccharide--protein glycosyltransferase subunit 1 [Saitoella coloradoensis]
MILPTLSSLLFLASLASAFTPPANFKHSNLLRTIDLTKPYVRETYAVVVQNIADKPVSEYYWLAPRQDKVAYVEAKEKKSGGNGAVFEVERVVEDDGYDHFPEDEGYEYYRISFPTPLAPSEKLTLTVSSATVDSVSPHPYQIPQNGKQYLQWHGYQFAPSAYETEKQRTKLKLKSADIPDVTTTDGNTEGAEDPVRAGTALTYGPYGPQVAGAKGKPIAVRYEFQGPVVKATKFERDIEISHWGGNLAVEERYWLSNVGAVLKGYFSRVQYQQSAYTQPISSAVRSLRYSLHPTTRNAYFTDEIGNVSTSRFRAGREGGRNANLDIFPRYPVFGGWNYSYTVGWDQDLSQSLKQIEDGKYAIKVPFLEGPESMQYEDVKVRIVLPEGAKNIQVATPFPVKESRSVHKWFMDTIGKPVVELSAQNIVDDVRGREVVVIYELGKWEMLRKPMTVAGAVFATVVVSFIFGKLDLKI